MIQPIQLNKTSVLSVHLLIYYFGTRIFEQRSLRCACPINELTRPVHLQTAESILK